MAYKAIKETKQPGDTLYCAMLDARRMEVYAAIYDHKLNAVRPVSAEVITTDTCSSFLETNRVCFFGNGAAKCKKIITSPHALFIDNIVPLAGDMATLAHERFANNKFEDTAYFEPFYLKGFIATVAKNKVLGNNS
jgi:tRNA threonylcarbamoyladenosine biosynthesis protein TsaB